MKEILVAILPAFIHQIGEGIREAIRHRREMNKCEHGRPGGRLCSKCFDSGNEDDDD